MVQKLGRPHNFRALSKPKHIHKHEHHHYHPYIPVLLLLAGAFFVSLSSQRIDQAVLAYTVNASPHILLETTNGQRVQNGVGSLAVNSALSAAAQAKADDMVTRNYWSHNTPDGQAPWTFVETAGYEYQKVGENLAYGFSDGGDIVTGWMNSEGHRANLLDSAYSEVGFGFANSANYNNDGPETVVVAMYGKPKVLAAAPASASEPLAEPLPAASKTAVSSDSVISEPSTTAVARVQNLTGGQAPWALFVVGLVTGLAVMALLAKHAAGLRHLLRDSEKFILHHPLLDTVLVGLVLAGSFLSQTTGFIR